MGTNLLRYLLGILCCFALFEAKVLTQKKPVLFKSTDLRKKSIAEMTHGRRQGMVEDDHIHYRPSWSGLQHRLTMAGLNTGIVGSDTKYQHTNSKAGFASSTFFRQESSSLSAPVVK